MGGEGLQRQHSLRSGLHACLMLQDNSELQVCVCSLMLQVCVCSLMLQVCVCSLVLQDNAELQVCVCSPEDASLTCWLASEKKRKVYAFQRS